MFRSPATAARSRIRAPPSFPGPPLNESASRRVASPSGASDAGTSKTLSTVWVGEYPLAAHESVWFFQYPGVHPSVPVAEARPGATNSVHAITAAEASPASRPQRMSDFPP